MGGRRYLGLDVLARSRIILNNNPEGTKEATNTDTNAAVSA